MEVRCHPGHDQRSQPFLAPKLAEPRSLKWAWLEKQYRRLKLRYKVNVGIIAGLKTQLAETERKMWEGEMNSDVIMACREFIEAKLGVNSVRLRGLNISSPFFDDLIYGIVGRLISETSRANKAEMALVNCLPAPAISGQQTLTLFPIPSTANTVSFYINNAASAGTLVTSGTSYSSMVGHIMTGLDMARLDEIVMPDGRAGKVTLPDGTRIEVDSDGSYIIDDKDAKVVYRANRVREFNRFINASDILAKFIEFCGNEASVTRDEMLELPVKLFIQYLILEAAKADGEPEPTDLTLVTDLHKAVNCLGCDQPLPPERRARKLHYCGAGCLERHELEAVAA